MLEALQARVTLSGAAFASQGKLFNLLSLQQKQPEMVEQFLYPMSWCFWTKFCLGEHKPFHANIEFHTGTSPLIWNDPMKLVSNEMQHWNEWNYSESTISQVCIVIIFCLFSDFSLVF